MKTNDHFLLRSGWVSKKRKSLYEGAANQAPLRSELFSAYQMEQHGKILAETHVLSEEQVSDQLLSRLDDNEQAITSACNLMVRAVKSNRQIAPAAEWLLDNFYLIEEQIRTAKKHLPKGYSRGLPLLKNGKQTGLPRVYEIALEIISHGDAHLDYESLTKFLRAYQEIAPLKLGELWAIPIMLRIALIENLRRVAARLYANRINSDLANHWADKMTDTAEKDPSGLILEIADMARSSPPMEASFVAELARRLQGHGPALALPLTWIEQRLSQSGLTIEQLVYSEIQQQAADQVSISNSIGSLRLLGTMNWRKFVEASSVVEQILRDDPLGMYEQMDFSTRDRYRHCVERVAKNSARPEFSVAQKALELARQNQNSKYGDRRANHVGYYLIDEGLPVLEQEMKMRLPFVEMLRRKLGLHPVNIYIGSITLLTALICSGLILNAMRTGLSGGALVAFGIVCAIAASHLSVALVNWLATMFAKPHPLPRMDFVEGVPPEARTLIAVPTLLTSVTSVDGLLEDLEVRYLANRGVNLHFALLTDFPDADSQILSNDESLLEYASKGISRLNNKYVDYNEDIFFLFHRPREWNDREKVWMGYERKRGKLGALNEYLREGENRFSHITGRAGILRNVKYVLTLDTDTQLPRDSALQMISAMAHPLNRPYYDDAKQRITKGYGIIQPRVAVSLPGTDASLYAQLSGGEPGIDPYTRAVSDVYQDAFREGSFIGKGIYDVDAFERSLKDKFPENRILSHDLLEGCYARSGLLSDVQLYEEYPSKYSADVARRHRWIRGDWQIINWLMPRVKDRFGRKYKNPLSGLSRWKIFDNLRRSAVPLSMVAVLLLGWTVLNAPVFWTLAVLGILLIPSLSMTILDLARKSRDVTVEQHITACIYSMGRHFAHALFMLVSLPYEAYYNTDAILRSLWRMTISHKKLLEWNPSSETNARSQSRLYGSLRMMWVAPVLAIVAGLYIYGSNPFSFLIASPVLSLWLVSPVLVWWLSRPILLKEPQLSKKQISFLRKLTRKTWAFYETYVGAEDNWLPPDNVQEQPVYAVAHRTSPTNIGLALLANMTAYDFGFIPLGQLICRTDDMFESMAKLERFQGHFYNWYDTQSLEPLHPRYVSTVDSGNLAGHLLVLRSGLLNMADQPLFDIRLFEGLRDTLNIICDHFEGAMPDPLKVLEQNIVSAYLSQPLTLSVIKACLNRAIPIISGFAEANEYNLNTDIAWWAKTMERQCRQLLDELVSLAPWIVIPESEELIARVLELNKVPSLKELGSYETELLPAIVQNLSENAGAEDSWLETLKFLLPEVSRRARKRIRSIEKLCEQAQGFSEMEYEFLYDRQNHLFTIGYNVSDQRKDGGYYDLLASEARLGNFVAVAQGHVPQQSWFALGRQMVNSGGRPTLLSWSGSMFEYLMPLLVMPTYGKTLLDQTYKTVIVRQIEYGAQRGVPWGVSESGYNMFDASLNYQYRAFGVPGLGIKRGLADDLVIAPYATAMGLMVDPDAACKNLQRLSQEGFEGKFGHFEAIDYTVSRLPRGKERVVIQSFMVHHLGMSFLALSYLLLNRPMQKRFEADPLFQSAILLLHEKVPKAVSSYMSTPELSIVQATDSNKHEMSMRFFNTPHTPIPEVHMLSNGRYLTVVSNAGGGMSRWKDLAVTRWREDGTRDNWGSFCYVRDLSSGDFWSTGFQPTLKQPKNYEVIFSEGRAEIRRTDGDMEMHTEIVVSPEDDIELRRTRIKNRSRTRRTIEVTSYAEVVLAPAAADMSHPAFSNLFVQTEILHKRHAILCTRRARSITENPPWMLHQMSVHGAKIGNVSYETDRMKFIGRGNSTAAPDAITRDGALSGTQGSVLDPIVAIRYQITIEPEQVATVDIVSGAADTREICEALVDKYQDSHLADRVFELAWTHSHVILRQLNITESDAQLYGRLASSIIYANTTLRADPSVLIKNRRGQSGLWSYAISGDLPIILVQIKDISNIDLVRQLVQAHAYWRLKGLAVDLVIWNEDHAGYRQHLQDQILGMISAGIEAHVIDKPGGIFVRPGDQISPEDRILLETVARIILKDDSGTLSEQVNRIAIKEPRIPRLVPTQIGRDAPVTNLTRHSQLMLDNGIGGFTPDGQEYVISTKPNRRTPAPWSNVIANPYFGTVISEAGQAYTWSENAHSFRLTPWHNDPVSDSSGEAFYIRDDESGKYWSPIPATGKSIGHYVTRHGFGYSVFEHINNGIQSQLWIYVATDAPVKFSVLKIKNISGRTRRLSATGYMEWVLGDTRAKHAMHVVTEIDPKTGAIFAQNHYNAEFADNIAFFDVDEVTRSVTGDRREFIGRNGSLKNPSALERVKLSGKTGAGLDPCAAIQVPLDLADGQEREVIFRMGIAGRRSAEASAFVRRFRGQSVARSALASVKSHWQETLGAVKIETPDPAIDVLANGWLMYQTIACRLWARSGYYQSGGAFGFRDQLQDTMALLYNKPQLMRDQLLLCAAHQFVEGDVQHWWHPPTDRGVRTKCSDDYLWLPLATCRYVTGTGDTGVLDEMVHFIEGRLLNADEDSYYDAPHRSSEQASLYEHCVRAIKRVSYGEHGLPLIGSCDWNDGMDKVGEHGKGESVWLGFFLYDILLKFARIAELRNDNAFAETCRKDAEKIRGNIEANAWDGNWYRRAYFDDGTPLGSASNVDCQIDSLSQSWSILSGAGDPERSRQGMEAVDQRLVRREYGLIQLLDPPFDKSDLNPGYIRGYVPGVRENGGQYTHAAIWTAMAFAKMGDRKRAFELLRMINPLNHAKDEQELLLYKVEPYVVAADVYGVPPHTGRGGWTWYTGSSGWMYRLIVESILGLKLEIDKLSFEPCLPEEWDGFKMQYRFRATVYMIEVSLSDKNSVILDGQAQEGNIITLVDDQSPHNVRVGVKGL